jgi:Peptidase family M1 domain
VTEVIASRRKVLLLVLFALAAVEVCAQARPQNTPKPSIGVLPNAPSLHLDPAMALFLKLQSVGLDPERVYRVRDVTIDRAAFHITLDDGVIGFTSDVSGQVTGALFEGEGEILLTPPDQVERASMMLQTGAAILEESFSGAYFRFNDDTFAQMRPLLMPAENSKEFALQWDGTARNLAQGDALRLFMTYSKLLSVAGENASPGSVTDGTASDDRFLHARLQGVAKGTFDVYFDSESAEQVWAAQARTVDSANYYDVWTSFSFLPKAQESWRERSTGQEERANSIDILNIKVRAEIKPPTLIEADAVLDVRVRRAEQRALLFELARTLVVKKVDVDGEPVEFIHNPSIDGTQLARRGNDLVVVVLPRPAHTEQRIRLHFSYGGEVLSEAGPGLLYVGARGTWYPNRGIAMSNFDLEFHYPPGWTLVATGKRVDTTLAEGSASGTLENSSEQVSHWVSNRPIPFAGFNLGKYRTAVVQAGEVTVEAFGTAGVERGFPQTESEPVVIGPPAIARAAPPLAIPAIPPSPARNLVMVAETAARAIEFYSARFGPYPAGKLALTQMPGNLSQGWPGLVFLSSYSFLNDAEKSALHFNSVQKDLIGSVIAHETAHQWWGDLVTWDDYRDQWISEGLANYSSMLLLQEQSPHEFHAVMDKYRDDLLQKNPSGVPLMEDGPVTLGNRLSCSQFPQGYEAISYGRGTWLFYMLRTMMRDAEPGREKSLFGPDDPNEPFMRALRRIRERYEGQPISTRQLVEGFQEELPRSLWYEGRKSLDWFYDGWVNGTAIPRWELRGVKYSDKDSRTLVSGTLLQQEAPKDLVTPVPLYSSRAGKLVFLGRVFADGPETTFHVIAPAGTRKILVDPNQTLLARPR